MRDVLICVRYFFFFSSRRRHTRCSRDWSSDVCSSDLLQIANGLAAAHDKHIIHRDLKPENLFITRDGRMKILDFGIAKLTAPELTDERSLATLTTQTKSGSVLGTVAYMSPEQLRGKSVDHRSDIFSFGTVLYEMLAGHRAFSGETEVDTITAVLREIGRAHV